MASDRKWDHAGVDTYSVEDDMHPEDTFAVYQTEEAAIDALCRLATIPGGAEPNIPPCSGGHNGCGRLWGILSASGWRPMLEVSADGRRWLDQGSVRQTRWHSRRQRLSHGPDPTHIARNAASR
jgi:hypothetical protein